MKTKIHCLVYIIILFMISASTNGQAKEPGDYLALVVELKGEISVKRKDTKDFTAVMWGNYIYQGDLVKAGSESQVSLLFANGTMIELSANSQMVIKQHPGLNSDAVTTAENEPEKVVPQLSRLQIKSYPFKPPEVQIAKDGSQRLFPTIRSADVDTLILSPRMTTINTQTPEFKWSSKGEDMEYRLTLSDANGTIWQTTTKDTHVESRVTLRWGESYVWTLDVYRGVQRVQGPFSTQFKVLSQQDFHDFSLLLKKMQKLDADKRSKNYYHLIMGFTYLKYDLIEKAIEHFRELAQANPAAAFPHEALCRLYLDQQLQDKAQAHYRKWHNLLEAEVVSASK